jgi:hypothetical protein
VVEVALPLLLITTPGKAAIAPDRPVADEIAHLHLAPKSYLSDYGLVPRYGRRIADQSALHRQPRHADPICGDAGWPLGYNRYVFSAGDVAERLRSSDDRSGRYSSAIVCRAAARGLRQAQSVSKTEHSDREAGASTKQRVVAAGPSGRSGDREDARSEQGGNRVEILS